jgi:hypothetical protein
VSSPSQATPDPRDYGSTWPWREREFAEPALGLLGSVTLSLLNHPSRWIHRRVDRLHFKDYKSAHHQTSVDFTLPSDITAVGTVKGQRIYAAPLFLLAKDHPSPLEHEGTPIPTAPYANIDLVDRDGTRSLLVRKTACEVAAIALCDYAKELVGPLEDDLARDIADIAMLDTAEHHPARDSVFGQPTGTDSARGKLQKHPGFRELAFALSMHSPVICLFQGHPGRTIVKLAYDEQTTPGVTTRKERALLSLGLKSDQYFMRLTEIGAAETHHVEIDLPKELELNEMGLVGTTYEHFAEGDLPRLTRNQQDYYIRQVGHSPNGTIYIREPVGRRVGVVWASLRARRAGFLAGALIASIIIAATLALATGAAHAVVQTQRPEAAIAILLLVPTLLAAYVAREGEHAITARMLRWARVALAINGMLPFLAAFALITSSEYQQVERAAARTGTQRLQSPTPKRRHTSISAKHHARHRHHRAFLQTLRGKWLVLTLVACGFVVFFLASFILPLPKSRDKTRYVIRE